MSARHDSGLAHERTTLAWQRTAVSLGAVAFLMLVTSLSSSAPWALAPAAAVPLAAAIGAARHPRDSPAPARAPQLRALTLAAAAAALAAALVALLD